MLTYWINGVQYTHNHITGKSEPVSVECPKCWATIPHPGDSKCPVYRSISR
jgi:hypothetical protein